MFGKKIGSQRFFSEPRMSLSGKNGSFDEETDQIISVLSETFELDLDFDAAHIFSAKHWNDPQIGPMLSRAGMESEMRGNKLPLLMSPRSLMIFKSLPASHPIRQLLEESGFGTHLFDPHAENGFSDEIAETQRRILKGLAEEYPQHEAQRYAVFDFHAYSKDFLLGRTKSQQS